MPTRTLANLLTIFIDTLELLLRFTEFFFLSPTFKIRITDLKFSSIIWMNRNDDNRIHQLYYCHRVSFVKYIHYLYIHNIHVYVSTSGSMSSSWGWRWISSHYMKDPINKKFQSTYIELTYDFLIKRFCDTIYLNCRDSVIKCNL